MGKRPGQGKPGPGRPKGSRNKFTVKAREAFEIAFENLGSVEALTEWARSNQSEFYRLYARLIPAEQHIGGTDGQPLSIAWPLPKHPLEQ